jgi:uncharacterized protein
MAAKFELKSAKGGKFMFNLKSANGQIVLTSETYDTKKNAEKGIASVRKNATNTKRFEKKESKKKEPYFVLTASNGEIIGKSEMYTTTKSMEKGIASVQKNAPECKVSDLTEAEAKPAAKKAAKAAKAK